MRVVVCDPIHEAGIDRLREAGFDVALADDATGDALDDLMAGADALVVRSATTVSAERIALADGLAIVARAGIGVDNIDLDAATEAGVQVVNAPTGGVGAVTEHTIAMAHALVRELPWTDRLTRAGEWPKGAYAGSELAEHTLGVLGLGRIGRSVAARAAALGMDVVGHDPHVDAAEVDVALHPLEACVDRADILTVHTPLSEGTVGLVDGALLDRLEGGYLINTARGGIVDEPALVDALESGHLAGAALDVFADEPIGADHPLTRCERTLLTPHVAGTSERAQRTIATSVAEQIIALDRGEPVEFPVNDPDR